MLPATVAAGSALTLGAATLYGVVALRFARRGAAKGGEGGRAVALFALFWGALAFYGATDALWSLAVPLFAPPLALGVAILYAKTVVATVGFFALVDHLLFLYSGSARLRWPIALAYGLIGAFVLYTYVSAAPIGQEVQTWRSGLVYAENGRLLDTIAVLALFVPPALASLAYMALYWRVEERAVRLRILSVSASLFVFFGGTALGWTLPVGDWWPLVERGLAIAAVSAVLQAHTPGADGA